MATEDDELRAIRLRATEEASQIRAQSNQTARAKHDDPFRTPMGIAEVASQRHLGTIHMVNYTIGWGLIRLDGGGMVYFHRTGLRDFKSFIALARHKRVEFSITTTKPELGPRAVDIVPFDHTQAA